MKFLHNLRLYILGPTKAMLEEPAPEPQPIFSTEQRMRMRLELEMAKAKAVGHGDEFVYMPQQRD